MNKSYDVGPLAQTQIRQAFPLVQAMAGATTLENWVSYASAMLGQAVPQGSAGIMGAVNRQGYIHGLFSYVVVPDLRHGRSLLTDNVLALNLRDRRSVIRALTAGMASLARRSDCGTIALGNHGDFLEAAVELGLIPVLDRPVPGHSGMHKGGVVLMVPPG